MDILCCSDYLTLNCCVSFLGNPMQAGGTRRKAVFDIKSPLDLVGKVVTADAMHTQVEHARYLVEDKKADYFFTVSGREAVVKFKPRTLVD